MELRRQLSLSEYQILKRNGNECKLTILRERFMCRSVEDPPYAFMVRQAVKKSI